MIAGHSRRVKSSALRGQRIVSLSKRDFDNKLNAPGVTLPIFSSQDHDTPVYIRSVTCWSKDIDLTCCSPWNSYGGDGVGGDSGNPAFLIIRNKPVLLSVWTSGGAGTGSFVNAWRSDINAAMTTLGGGYQLTSVSLK